MTNPLAPLEDDPTDAGLADGSDPFTAAGHEDPTRVFSRVLAHDASAVLGPMATAADALVAWGDASGEPSAIERAHVIANGCRRLGTILRRLMEPEAVRNQQPVDLNVLITNLVSMFRPLAGDCRQVLTRLEEPMRPVWVDPIDLEGALLALLLDVRGARDADRETSDAGPLVLSTSAAHSVPNGSNHPRASHWVVLEIEDRYEDAAGLGSSVAELPATDVSSQRWRAGLARMRQVARRVGGDIQTTRNPREGSRVRAWLPISAYGPSTRGPTDIRSRLQSAPTEDVARPRILSFPPFTLDRTNEVLWRDGAQLPLRARPFTILRYLAEHPQRLVTQRELVETIWGNVATSDSLLRTHVRVLRRVLGEGVIETIIGRGYRFVLEVTQVPEPLSRPRAIAPVTHAKSW
jgi:DNA-binding winged helix-turn-helix (wHTH) protein